MLLWLNFSSLSNVILIMKLKNLFPAALPFKNTEMIRELLDSRFI